MKREFNRENEEVENDPKSRLLFYWRLFYNTLFTAVQYVNFLQDKREF